MNGTSMTQDSSVAEICFDESGHDGENLMAGVTPVFAHGSIHMELEEAKELVAYLRKATRAQAPELKAADIMRSGDRVKEELFGPTGRLIGNTQVYLVEKASFAVGKIIDLLVEEEAYARGHNIYTTGIAKQLSDDLYEYGSRAIGAEEWIDLLSAFTSLMRTNQRKGGDKETVDGFFEKIDNYRYKSRRDKVTRVLELVWLTRKHADEFQALLANGEIKRTLDPLQTSLYQLAMTWHARIDRPIRILHDQQTALTPEIMQAILDAATGDSLEILGLPDARFPLVGIKQVDSKSDPRIQLADIAAGFTRTVAESALEGKAETKRIEQVRRLVHFNSLWGHNKSWDLIRPRE